MFITMLIIYCLIDSIIISSLQQKPIYPAPKQNHEVIRYPGTLFLSKLPKGTV